jgi:hypothetical protein
MNARVLRLAILLLLALGGAALGFYGVEADKEVRILCGLFTPGTPEREMDRIVGTANFLQVVETNEFGETVRVVHSRWNLGLRGCRVKLDDGVIVGNETWSGFGGLN